MKKKAWLISERCLMFGEKHFFLLTEIRDYFRLKLGKWAILKNAG